MCCCFLTCFPTRIKADTQEKSPRVDLFPCPASENYYFVEVWSNLSSTTYDNM
jgi:hypothetical protein